MIRSPCRVEVTVGVAGWFDGGAREPDPKGPRIARTVRGCGLRCGRRHPPSTWARWCEFSDENQRRARDSNPQPLAGHLISNQTMMVKQVPNTLRIARSDATGKRDSALVGQQGSSFLDTSLDTWFQTPTVAFFAAASPDPRGLKESLPVRGRPARRASRRCRCRLRR